MAFPDRFAVCLVGFIFIASPVVAQVQAPSHDELRALLRDQKFADLGARLDALQKRYETTGRGDSELWDALLAFENPAVETRDIDRWLAREPSRYAAAVAAAVHYRRLGWRARGFASSDNTPRARFADADRHFGRAAALARSSLGLAQKPIVSHALLIDLSRNIGDRPLLVEQLARAYALDRNNYIARSRALEALQPNWYGSLAAMEAIVTEAKNTAMAPDLLRQLEAQQLLLAAREYRRASKDTTALVERSLGVWELSGAQLLRAESLRNSGQEDASLRALERALQLDPGNTEALVMHAERLWKVGQFEASIESYQRAARAGHAESAWFVGATLERGDRVKARPAESFQWYALGARLGSPSAMARLGICLLTDVCGTGHRNNTLAELWLKKAFDYGNRSAALDLAWLYRTDPVLGASQCAICYLDRAARSADPKVRSRSIQMMFHPFDPWFALRGVAMLTGHGALALYMIIFVALIALAGIVAAIYVAREWRFMRRSGPGGRLVFPYAELLLMAFLPAFLAAGLLWRWLLAEVPERLAIMTFAALLLAGIFCLARALFIAYLEFGSQIDSQGFTAVSKGRPFRFAWNDIVFARREVLAVLRWLAPIREHMLTIGTRDGTLYSFAIHSGLWKRLRTRLPKESLEDGALLRMPGHAERIARAGGHFDVPVDIQTIRERFDHVVTLSYVIGSVILLSYLGVMVYDLSIAGEQAARWGDAAWLVAGGMVAIDLVSVLVRFGLHVDEALSLSKEGICIAPKHDPRKRVVRGWNDVTSVTLGAGRWTIRFEGGGKPVRTSGPAAWHRYDRDTVFPKLLEFLEHKGIPVRRREPWWARTRVPPAISAVKPATSASNTAADK